MAQDEITLKWGSLKAWNITTPAARDILQKWAALGVSMSAIAHRDTAEQKRLLCELIDAADCDQIYLDWDGEYVSKDVAKAYVMDYAG